MSKCFDWSENGRGDLPMEGISLFSSKKLTSKFKKSLMKALSDSTDDSFCRTHSALMVFMSPATKSTMRYIRLIRRAWPSGHGLWRRGLKASIGLLVPTGYGPSMDTQSLPPGALRSMVCIDTYSRKLIWVYVGHSSNTQISVCK